MPLYVALEIEPKFNASDLELARTLWTPQQSFLEYICAKTRGNLRIAFQKVEIIRIIDDFSTLDLDSTPAKGMVPNHFGYIVTGAAFWNANADTIESGERLMSHYRFITGNSCVDIISSATPHYRVLAVAV